MKQRIKKGRVFPFVFRLLVYLLLTGLAFVFVYPFLNVLIDSFKSYTDISNINVKWVPREPTLMNYKLAWEALNTLRTGFNSIFVSVVATIGHVISCSIVAYGFARFRFPLRNVLFAIVILSILIPTQTIIVPLYITYSNLHMLDSFLPMLVPAFFGFGLRGGIFIFLFRQYFLKIPKSLEEAASIDGCGPIRVFFRIALPTAGATLVVCILLSLVWHWNDYYEPSIYLSGYDQFLLPQMLSMLSDMLANMQTSSVEGAVQGGLGGLEAQTQVLYHRGVVMAASAICLLPPFLLYTLMQRKFMEGVERTGLVE